MPRVPRFPLALAAAGLVAAIGAAPASGQQASGAAVDGQALVDRYCVTCHNDRLETGGFSFEPLDVADVAAHPEAWEKVVRKLRAGAMPPRPRPRPDRETYDGFRAWIEGELDVAAAADLNPGRTETFHRLSRTEYRNAVRDLLALDVGVDDLLPADDTSYGFDNIAGVLGVSPTLMERYLSAARKISRLAVASPVPSPTAETFRIASDLGQDRRMERLPFGTRGGMVLDYNFPGGRGVRLRDPAGRAVAHRAARPGGHHRRRAHRAADRRQGARSRRSARSVHAADRDARGAHPGHRRAARGGRSLPAQDVGGAGGDPQAVPAPVHRRGIGRRFALPALRREPDHRRAVRIERRAAGRRDAEPGAHLRLPSGAGRDRGGRGRVRAGDPVDHRAARVPPARHRRRRRAAPDLLRPGAGPEAVSTPASRWRSGGCW